MAPLTCTDPMTELSQMLNRVPFEDWTLPPMVELLMNSAPPGTPFTPPRTVASMMQVLSRVAKTAPLTWPVMVRVQETVWVKVSVPAGR
ncbi:hypothetical protein [Streptomyces mirabilis]|uniref:hypothetical protein n=2 Tax=Streptomyces mirabilis TaxID=68239 RepID=UPI002250AF65|nr:hypothetical protein [Streptomyces mirabilis]MCX4427132.1 hypothetical protein [Streptomyces mirabilis]